LGLPKEICAFPKLSARLWPCWYRDCEKVLTDSQNNSLDLALVVSMNQKITLDTG